MIFANLVAISILSLFGILICSVLLLIIRSLWISRNKVPNYTLKEAQEKVQKGQTEYRSTLLVIVTLDIISWFWLGRSGPLDSYLIAIGVVNSLLLLAFLSEYQNVGLAKKRIARLTDATEADTFLQSNLPQTPVPRPQPFSPEVWQVAGEYLLGEPVAIYQPAFRMYTILLGGGAVLILLADLSGSSLLLTKVIAGLIGWAILFRVWFPKFRARQKRIYVYTKGVAYVERYTTTALRWQDMARVRYRGRLTRLGNPFCQVLMKDGSTITFSPQILGVEEVGKEIEAHLQ